MNKLFEKWVELTQWLSVKGIPIPLFRDAKTGVASATFTMMMVTFIFCVLSLIAKVSNSKAFGDINFSDGFELFIATSALYLGRKMQTPNATVTVEADDSAK